MNSKSIFQTLDDVYSLVADERDHDFPSEDLDVQRIKETYSLSDSEIVMVSYLLHSYPEPVSRGELLASVENMDDSPKFVLKVLIEKKFARISPESPFFSSARLTDIAYNALRKEAPIRLIVIDDCLDTLKNCSLGDIYSRPWLEEFNRALSLPVNRQFSDAAELLGLTSMSRDMQLAFWVIARHFTHYFLAPLAFPSGEDLVDDTSCCQEDLKLNLSLLVKEGLVQTLPVEPLEDTKDTDRFVLAPKVVGLLFRGHEEFIRYDEISRYANVVKAKDIVEKELFFPPETLEDIEHLRRMISREGFERACRILKRQKRNQAIQSLLWGSPGTGKTEIVKQIARESGRDIIIFDVSKVTASAWGAAEKFYRAVFRAYNYMAEISREVPILLLNEADTILGRRLSNLDKAIDKSENAISNILLQEFEDMSGILLATTNLVDNMDDAFDRRFLFKTQFKKPDADARYHIWLSVIPELGEYDARTLANMFEMSGAQISNVATKRNLAELYYDGDRGLSYIEGLCRKELAIEKNGKRQRIGF